LSHHPYFAQGIRRGAADADCGEVFELSDSA
jgi:hypothetical protein